MSEELTINEQYEIIFNNTQDALFLMKVTENDEIKFQRLNRAHEKQTGLKTKEVKGKTPQEILGETVGAEVEVNYRRCIESGESIEYEEELDFPSGKKVYHTTLTPVFRQGRVAQIVGSGRDITERKKAEKRLKKLKERFEMATSSAGVGVWELNLKTEALYWSEEMYELYGLKKDEVENKYMTWVNNLHPEDKKKARQNLERAVAKKCDFEHDFRVVRSDGDVRYIRGFGRIFSGENEEDEYMLGVNYDITQQKEFENQLEQARDEALKASRAKSAFLATMSHEIRTPMNSIIGMSELLQETNLNAEQENYLEILENAGESLLALINDVLDLSKIEADQIVMEEIEFSLEEVINKVTELVSFKAYKKGLDLVSRIAPAVPTELYGDPSRLRQILLNLMSNAVKFTSEGEVVLEVKLDQEKQIDDQESVELLFSVRDTGIGISPEIQEHIFESFTQADASSTREYGGTGLGLTISKRLVNLMNGEIGVDSTLGEGSTFYFKLELPVAKNSVVTKPELEEELNLDGMSVLAVDDNSTNLLILEELLTDKGAELTLAENGMEAISELRKNQKQDKQFQLILLDLLMPKKDGNDVAEFIREELKSSEIKIVMLTSNLGKEKVTCRDHVDKFIFKPIRRKELIQVIGHQLYDQTKENKIEDKKENHLINSDKERESGQALDQPLQILLVDDAQENRLLVNAHLKSKNCEIEMAENGVEAFRKFKEHEFDLVLMDLQMPKMDGYEATRRIKQWEEKKELKPTPIVALTAHALTEDIKKTKKLGFDSHFTKPIKKAKLINLIDKCSI